VEPPSIRVGTSGWIYPHWKGRFYPKGLSERRWLGFLAQRLPTVEVNGTFYSLTRPSACDAWREATPPGFLFALKGSRYVTHMLKLRNFRPPLANFFASGILRLGARLGPILWQLPPHLPFDAPRADAFFAALPEDVRGAERWARRHDERTTGRATLTAPDGRDRRLRYAVEVRHASWLSDEALALLERRHIALAAADAAGKHPFSLVRTSPDLAYVRLHGARELYEGAYTAEELREWAARCRTWAREGAEVYVYFDNDRDAQAVRDALHLHALVHGREPAATPDRRGTAGERPKRPRRPPSHFGFRRGSGRAPSSAT